jgi:hypothetical protein
MNTSLLLAAVVVYFILLQYPGWRWFGDIIELKGLQTTLIVIQKF